MRFLLHVWLCISLSYFWNCQATSYYFLPQRDLTWDFMSKNRWDSENGDFLNPEVSLRSYGISIGEFQWCNKQIYLIIRSYFNYDLVLLFIAKALRSPTIKGYLGRAIHCSQKCHLVQKLYRNRENLVSLIRTDLFPPFGNLNLKHRYI